MSQEALLRVENLRVQYNNGQGANGEAAVDGLSFTVHRHQTLALVGESGSGKSTTGLALLRLLPATATVRADTLAFEGQDLQALTERQMGQVRGGGIGMVFQDAQSALNPVMCIGTQLVEAVQLHRHCRRAEAERRAVELLQRVRIPDPVARMQEYPHRLSGGMRQRVVIALALAGNPSVLIADEPTTALDVTIQAQILALLRTLQQELGMGILLITHDLGIVAEVADHVIVMRQGRSLESQSAVNLFAQPRHAYTQSLLAARHRALTPKLALEAAA